MFTQSPGMTTARYAEKLIRKPFQCGDIYEEQERNETFIRGLNKSIRHSMRGYWPSKKSASLQDLAFYAPSLLNFQRGDHHTVLNSISIVTKAKTKDPTGRIGDIR